jgi:hypothetical protein
MCPPAARRPSLSLCLRSRRDEGGWTAPTAAIAGLVVLVLAAAAMAATAFVLLNGESSGAASAPSPRSPDPSSSSTSASPSPSAAATQAWRLKSYREIGYDKSFKADLIDELPAPPELVVFGGSRARRFDPSYLSDLTGLESFNCAVQCFRPEDAWAFSSYLFSRAPDVRLHAVIALQTRTFHDDTMRPGLLYDSRLASAFPADLVAEQKAALGTPEIRDLLEVNRYLARGRLVRNQYDITRERAGYSFDSHLALYVKRQLANHTWNGPLADARSREYFEKTMRLYNDHGVVPLIIVMPYQPWVLQQFRRAGFQKYLDGLNAYLRDAATRCDFRVLDLTDVATFGGSATGFYDGVHVTRENADLIARYAVRAAPECFR